MAYSNYRSDWNRDRNERWRTHDRERDRDQQYTQRDDDDSRLARESMERDYYGGGESGGRGGYSGREQEDQGPRYSRGYGRGDYDQEYGRRHMGQGGRFSESGYGRGRDYSGHEGRRHYGNEMGGWPGREDEQWRNRDTHGQYDREANYGGFSTGTGNYSGYGEGGSYQGGQGPWGQAGTQYSQGGRGYGGHQGQSHGQWDQGGEYGRDDYHWRGSERGRYGQGGYGQERGYRQRYVQGPGQGQAHGQRGGRQYGQGSYSPGRPSGGRAYGEYSGTPSGYFGEDYGGSDWQRRSSQGQGQWGQEQDYGQHRGRGPRGYKRSDDRIREEVCDCLTDDDELDAGNIEISVKDGEVTLTGFVTKREDKRWAESLAERISGVKEVQNSLRVQDQQRTQSGTSGIPGAGASGTTSTGTTGTKGKESNVQH